MATIFKSSIGKKLIQSISGAFLILFLLLHGTINFFSVIDSWTGKFGAADGLYQKGCDFMSTTIIKIMVPILALGFVVHILWGLWLTWGNIRARGGYFRYAGGSKSGGESWAARNMFVLGIIVLGLLAFHLTHFWAKMQLQEFLGNEPANPYLLLCTTFRHWWILLIYLIWFLAIWFHLSHGFWSMFQTVGWSNNIWGKRLKVIGYIVATLIFVIFALCAINGHIEGCHRLL
ncbi:MAG: succinate dehydrogenase cytochrome b subunit [Bacteroidales bacterium]|nr:succinate dehydrogenase cytochrome b subunit [Bacteroidales bacterium]